MFMRFGTDGADKVDITKVVMKEKEQSLSQREWMHRIAGYGLTLKDTDDGQMIASLSTGEDICFLPA
jgi:hypothetical protein